MPKTKLELAINIAIDILIIYYLIMLINPNLKIYLKNHLQMVRFEIYKLMLAKWLLEAKQVRGQI